MYVPSSFAVNDSVRLREFIASNGFATLVTYDGNVPFASHLPILLRRDDHGFGTLVAHMARANPQWRHFADGREALVIFQGPHAYVSPMWYESQPAVPTWNFTAVHVYGTPRIVSERTQVLAILDQLVTFYESPRTNPWSGELPDDYRDQLVAGIVAFEIPVRHVEGKFKLGQNRSQADQDGVAAALAQSDRESDRHVAAMMRRAT